jgi:hypothetical protein
MFVMNPDDGILAYFYDEFIFILSICPRMFHCCKSVFNGIFNADTIEDMRQSFFIIAHVCKCFF